MSKILLACGIGDFVALECYLSMKETFAVKSIYWATRAKDSIMPLIPYVFPNVTEHITVKDDWGDALEKNFCIECKEDLKNNTLQDVEDYSVSVIFNQILNKQRSYQSSSIIKRKLCDISHFNLPDRYFLVHPYSDNARTPARDLTKEEWIHITNSLSVYDMPIVVINKGKEALEFSPNVIDLSNKTNLMEAIEIAKGSAGFYGASSAFSVVCSKVLPHWKMYVKGHNFLKDIFWHFYYAPLETNSFISDSLIKPIPKFVIV